MIAQQSGHALGATALHGAHEKEEAFHVLSRNQ
jgi:hypothetical protein